MSFTGIYSIKIISNNMLKLVLYSLLLAYFICLTECQVSEEASSIESDVLTVVGLEKANPFWFDDNSIRICNTKNCQLLGKQLKTWMNESINPCSDFYEFVCENYDENVIIAPDMVVMNSFQSADLAVLNILQKQLSEPNIDCEPDSVKYASNMFKGCTDFKTLESIGVKPLLEILNKVYNGWPIIGYLAPFYPNSWEVLDILAKSTALLSESCIIELNVYPCIKNTANNCLYIAPSPSLHLAFGLIEEFQNKTYNHWLPDPPPMASKKPRIIENITRQTFIDIERSYYTQQVSIISGNVNTDTVNQIQQVIELSSQLDSCLTPNLVLNNSFNELTFDTFNDMTGTDWLMFVNKVYKYTGLNTRFIKKDTLIVVDINYFICLKTILSNTDKQVLANFLGFCFVNDFGIYTVQAFRDLSFKLFQLIYGTEQPKPLWIRCVELVRNSFGFAISRKYIDKYFSKSLKVQITELTRYVQDVFERFLETNPILDDYSRTRSLKKLKAITKNVGYPEWIYDDKTIDNLYLLTEKCNKDRFFNCLVHFTNRFSYKLFKSKFKPVNKTIHSWPFDPTVINAAYFTQLNSITIPAAFIKSFYTCEYPRAYIYGTIAFILGHEFTHGFDGNGHQFDQFGNLNSIFDKMTTKLFFFKEQCFIDQYNKCCNPDINLCVNGILTAGENTADNGGIREAYFAFKMSDQYNGSPKVLPILTNYTADQLFFISYASIWCDKLRPEYVANTYFDVHSPAKFRVNTVFSNTKAFSDAFNCPPDSPMNPNKKCILW